MIQTAAIFVAIALVMTIAGTIRGRGKMMTAAWVAPLYGGLVILVIISATWAVHASREGDYRRCVDLASRSAGSHAATIRLYDAIDVLTHTTRYTSAPVAPGQPSLRDGLNIDLPILDPADCTKP